MSYPLPYSGILFREIYNYIWDYTLKDFVYIIFQFTLSLVAYIGHHFKSVCK